MPNEPTLFTNAIDDNRPLTGKQEERIDKVGNELGIIKDGTIEIKQKLIAFNEILNRRPLARMVRKHQNFLYLPIRYHKRLAQQLFLGQTREEVIHYMNIFNEITVHLRFHYRHPITNEWLFVDGLGSAQIMQDKDTKVSDFALFKKPNALQTCLPKARTEAYKNATSQLGAIFGSDLNRQILENEGDYDARTHTIVPLNK